MRFRYTYRKMSKLFANSGDPDQTPHSAASDLNLHCLSVTLFGVSRIKWVNAVPNYNELMQLQTVKYYKQKENGNQSVQSFKKDDHNASITTQQENRQQSGRPYSGWLQC